MNIAIEDLSKLHREKKEKFGGIQIDYFGPLFLSRKFEKNIDELSRNFTFENNDLGIDSYYIDRDLRTLYLYKFEWSVEQSIFKESMIKFKENGLSGIFGEATPDQKRNKFLNNLRSEIHEKENIINKVILCYVYNGTTEDAESSSVLKTLSEDIETRKYLIDDFFSGRNISLTIQFASNETTEVVDMVHIRKTFKFEIEFSTSLTVKNTNNEVLSVGFIKMIDLYKIYEAMKFRLFDKNIRYGLSDDSPPNKSIKKSLENVTLGKESPEEFAFNHNGISLFAEKVEFINDKKIELVEPRVLNGAQTITSFYNFIEEHKDNKVYIENQKQISSIKVIAKVISNADTKFITNVTICTNKQNPVEPWNLRASDFIQVSFEDKFKSDLGIFYERQENSFMAYLDSDQDETIITQHKAIQIKKLAQTFLAIQGEIDKISRLTDIFENDTLYSNTFKEKYLESDSRNILVSYKIHYRLPSILREIEERGVNKYFYISKARNLVWALLIQGIFNDEKFDSIIDKFGNSITMENEFADYLKDLASKRVRPIIAEVVDTDYYQQNIQKSSFGFFKTKAIYQKSIDVASERFGWQKKFI